MMLNERDNPKTFQEARCIGRAYFEKFQVVLWGDHVSVIGTGIGEKKPFSHIDFYTEYSIWHRIGEGRTICASPIDLSLLHSDPRFS